MSKLVRGKTRQQLIEGLPSKIRLLLDWDGACDLTADRRNCIIHRALLHKEEITRPTVGTDRITFIWRGDARVEVVPGPHLLAALLDNDRAAHGLMDWPTGQQALYLPLDHVKVYDLRPARNRDREKRKSPEYTAVKNAAHHKWKASNPEAAKQSSRDYALRQKQARTKRERGRFVLS